MTERNWIKQHLVRAISQIQHVAVNRRFVLEACCFLVVTIQEPDSTVFFFSKKIYRTMFVDF